MRIWRNRQTRQIQVLVVAIPCVFKSHYPHHTKQAFSKPLRVFESAFSFVVLTLNTSKKLYKLSQNPIKFSNKLTFST